MAFDSEILVLQSRAPKYGIGRYHPKTATGHGRMTFLLLFNAKNGEITVNLNIHQDKTLLKR